jgi:hypothetical protein
MMGILYESTATITLPIKSMKANEPRLLKNMLKMVETSSNAIATNGRSRLKRIRGGGVNRQTATVRKRSANKMISDASLKIWRAGIANNAAIAKSGRKRRKRLCGINRQVTRASGIHANNMRSDIRFSRGLTRATTGNMIARNGMARRKRLRGVDCQVTIASGIPANKTTPNTNAALARMICPASVKTGSVAMISLIGKPCDKLKKKKAMTSEQTAAEKILVN